MQEGETSASFAHVHALIAEDDALIAFDMEQTIVARFGLKVSVAHSLQSALALIAADPPDVAVLAFELGGDSVEPLAQALDRAGAPIVFVSGYRSHPLETFARGLKVDKPHTAEELVAMVEQALARLSCANPAP